MTVPRATATSATTIQPKTAVFQCAALQRPARPARFMPASFRHTGVKAIGEVTDMPDVGRAATLVFVLAGLVTSGWQAWNHHRPSAKAVLETGTGREAAFELHSAGDQLDLTYKWAGTYDGPDLKNFKDLQLS